MAERLYDHTKSKSYGGLKEEETMKSKNRKRSHSKRDQKKHKEQMESKTPPLPTGVTSIEDLIKQRELLKEELNKISGHKRKENEDQHSKLSKKRKSDSSKPTHDLRNVSPTNFDDHSEDEEDIIENRRKQRKKLLEKFKSIQEENQADRIVQDIISSHKSTHVNIANKHIKDTDNKPDIKETTDMFSEIDDFTPKKVPDGVTKDNNNENLQLTENWDDPEGYYNVRVGDIINNNRYTIKSILGKGVFANVVKAQDNSKTNSEVAIKITRNNDLMHKTGIKEIAFLKQVNDADPDDKYHCVRLLGNFSHKGHLCIVLEPLYMDMRCVIKKYGRHGFNMKALMSYSRQLLMALRLLKRIGIIHADIKPDNILINEKKNVLKLCDFGSAGKANDNEPTPYLVSRFYRAPEIILGITYTHSVDLWSTACTIYEMAIGKIMFTGNSNNKMLKCFMDVKGRFPNKLIRKGKFKDQHFNYNNTFLLHKKDEISGRQKLVEMSNIKITRDLYKELKKASGDEKKITQLKDLLDKMLMLDPSQRISIIDALKHPFIQEDLQK